MAQINLQNVDLEFNVGKASFLATGQSDDGSVGSEIVERNGYHYVRALRNISLNIGDGERVGLMGHNGAGKTTLLKVMAKIYEPLQGRCRITGSLGPQFDASIGLHGSYTGLEAIRVRSLMIGLSKTECLELTRQVIKESDLGDYINLPISTYSAGMMTRLLTSLATSSSAEILLFDEGILAGDGKFQERIKNRVNDMLSGSKILVLAAHSAELLLETCGRGVVLKRGEIVFDGEVQEAINYHSSAY